MAQPRTLTSILWTFVVLALLSAGVALVVRSCGPSDLSKAYGPYDSKLRLRLDDEVRFWNQLADAASDQSDARGVEKYSAFLETKAMPYYLEMERALRGIEPGHPRLAAVNEAVLAYVRCKQEFVDLELKRLADLRGSIGAIMAIQEAAQGRDDAYQDYLTAIADEFPDQRMGALTTLYDGFNTEIYRPALAGRIEPDAAADAMRRTFLVAIRKLRDGRFQDGPNDRLFRKLVVATDEYLVRFAETLPATVRAHQATQRIQQVQEEMDDLQKEYQRLLREVQRDR